MGKPSTRIIDMHAEELLDLIERRVDHKVEPQIQRIESLEDAFALQAPSLDATHAAMYCGKSVDWINNLVRKHNLPRTKTVNKSTRYLRKHLDHLLCGGTFTEDGKMIPIEGETQMKRVGLTKSTG